MYSKHSIFLCSFKFFFAVVFSACSLGSLMGVRFWLDACFQLDYG